MEVLIFSHEFRYLILIFISILWVAFNKIVEYIRNPKTLGDYFFASLLQSGYFFFGNLSFSELLNFSPKTANTSPWIILLISMIVDFVGKLLSAKINIFTVLYNMNKGSEDTLGLQRLKNYSDNIGNSKVLEGLNRAVIFYMIMTSFGFILFISMIKLSE